MATDQKERLALEIRRLTEERDQLEAALPPHGLKPGHLLRIEELEDRIEALKGELENIGD